MRTAIQVLVADRAALIGEVLAVRLAAESDIEVVATMSVDDAVVAANWGRLDVAVIDLAPPDAAGIDMCAALRASVPSCRILVLAAAPATGHLRRAIAAGASGFLSRDTTITRLIEGVRTLAAGGVAIDPTVAAAALREPTHGLLTPREVDVLRLVARDLSTAAIAAELCLSAGTVRNYLGSVMAKTGTSTRNAAERVARERGLL
ncbi:MAG: LuxR C-terminal-related transcriptional regulator [Dermatophilaceae bacterium]